MRLRGRAKLPSTLQRLDHSFLLKDSEVIGFAPTPTNCFCHHLCPQVLTASKRNNRFQRCGISEGNSGPGDLCIFLLCHITVPLCHAVQSLTWLLIYSSTCGFFFSLSFERGSQLVAQAGLELITLVLSLLNSRITSIYHTPNAGLRRGSAHQENAPVHWRPELMTLRRELTPTRHPLLPHTCSPPPEINKRH